MPATTINETDQRRWTEQVLDVREDFEIAEGMIPGAVHMTMGDLSERVGELDADRPIIVVCRSGNRSAQVAEALNAVGCTADTMTGGMSAWQGAGLPTT
ncbi:rhodanese-like domain-containing protein [Arthrobacter rhombi]|uniref:rhodanese-like domain-containing protein n=1 Tax=Micrococcaceae TaxID=1268 RepID=UPI000BB7D931|nr:rhodanese-like domain-containing protein [Glutamicibacter sp. BW78]PCC24312.1 sulfurtransferase [Glutamicibacter sp. BW78]